MTINRSNIGETWLTPGDAQLLHALVGSLPAQIRRDLARTLQRVGATR
jgi:hypothetical protein